MPAETSTTVLAAPGATNEQIDSDMLLSEGAVQLFDPPAADNVQMPEQLSQQLVMPKQQVPEQLPQQQLTEQQLQLLQQAEQAPLQSLQQSDASPVQLDFVQEGAVTEKIEHFNSLSALADSDIGIHTDLPACTDAHGRLTEPELSRQTAMPGAPAQASTADMSVQSQEIYEGPDQTQISSRLSVGSSTSASSSAGSEHTSSTPVGTDMAQLESTADAADADAGQLGESVTAAGATSSHDTPHDTPWPDYADSAPVNNTSQEADLSAERPGLQIPQLPEVGTSLAAVGSTALQTSSAAEVQQLPLQQWPDHSRLDTDVSNSGSEVQTLTEPPEVQQPQWADGGSLSAEVGSSARQAASPAEVQQWPDTGSLEVNLGRDIHETSLTVDALDLQLEQWPDGSGLAVAEAAVVASGGHSQNSHAGLWHDVNSPLGSSVGSESTSRGLDSDKLSDPAASRSDSMCSSWSSSSSVFGRPDTMQIVPMLEGQGSAQSDILIVNHADEQTSFSASDSKDDTAEALRVMTSPSLLAAPEVSPTCLQHWVTVVW